MIADAYNGGMKNFKQPKSDYSAVYETNTPPSLPDISTPARATSVSIENEIRTDSTETGAFIHRAGNVLLRRTGLIDSVSFSAKELFGMEGTTFTHNHPLGSAFSLEDLALAMTWGLAEIRAVSRYFRHIATPQGKWSTTEKLYDIYPKAERHAANVVDDMIKSDNLDYRTKNLEYRHQIMLYLAKHLKFNYQRERT